MVRSSCGATPWLSPELASSHAHEGTIIATFTNLAVQRFALNWATQLQRVGLRSLVGSADPRMDATARTAFAHVGAGLFCADGQRMRSNGQAGRWPEVLPLLQLGYNLLLSDSDIGWFRSPLPYFAALRRAHPHADLLLCSDYVGNGYTTAPLPGGAEGDLDLDVIGNAKISSINIGVLFAYAGANRSVATLISAWADAVVDTTSGSLVTWDQGPINTKVLRPLMRPLPEDTKLVRVHGAGLGILPMLQFTTAFTYYIHAATRTRVAAAPFSLHAIFSHGKSAERKTQILREAGLWTLDPPAYYAEGRFLQLSPHEDDAYRPTLSTEDDGDADAADAADLRARGGVALLSRQLVRFYQGLRLAALLNRTLVLPRLRCGDAPMAYPCYAWYHRAMTKDAKWNALKVAMPRYCPTYYWLGSTGGVPWRGAGFLDDPRTHPAIRSGAATMHVCNGALRGGRGGSGGGSGCRRGASAAAGGGGSVAVPRGAPAATVLRLTRQLADAQLLIVHGASLLQGDGGAGATPRRRAAGARAAAVAMTLGRDAWGDMRPPPPNASVAWVLSGPF